MLPLERYRLAALGHTPEQINAIEVYEQKVKEDVTSKIRKILVHDVPESEYARPPHQIKSAIDKLLKDILR